MRLTTEELENSSRVLFVNFNNNAVQKTIAEHLAIYNFDFFFSQHLPKKLDQFSHIFVYTDESLAGEALQKTPRHIKLFLLFHDNKAALTHFSNVFEATQQKNIKAVNIDPKSFHKREAETLFWFFFSQSDTNILDLQKTIAMHIPPKKTHKKHFSSHFKMRRRTIVAIVLGILLFIELFFLIPLTTSYVFLYKGFRSLEKRDIPQAKKNAQNAAPFVTMTKHSYAVARPLYSFFFLALLPDNFVVIQQSSLKLLENTIKTADNGKKLVNLFFKHEKSEMEVEQMRGRIGLMHLQLESIESETTTIQQKLASYRLAQLDQFAAKLEAIQKATQQARIFSRHIDTLIGSDTAQKYLILFQNNMELRPGGGFIGSFGIATVSRFTLSDLEVYDVYEADGQLKGHFEPPAPIKKYLNQPHWFLRDSNFSPDFETNFKNAEFFLDKELQLSGFSGGIALDTTAISYLLEGFGELYIPDYNETITKDNFYIKTQTHVETDFFPGSQQKKTFLSSLLTAFFDKLESAEPISVAATSKRALEEKHIVMYFKDDAIQNDIKRAGYSGKLVLPTCAQELADGNTIACETDSFFPVDANLGVNKANFYVQRIINLTINIDNDGSIAHDASVIFKNNSPGEHFPGGTYKNFFRLYVPKDAVVDGLFLDDEKLPFEKKEELGTAAISSYIEIPPGQTHKVTLLYTLPKRITRDKTIYQLIVQKQIGAHNSDFVFELQLPSTFKLVDRNFTPLAKENGFVYNTTLSNDRIFLLELAKK